MIALSVVVHHELPDRALKRCLPEEDHAAQTFLFDGTHEPLGESIQIGRFWRQSNNVDAVPDENAAECVGVFRIPIENQVSLAAKKAVVRVGQIARDLRHPTVIRIGSNARDLYGAAGDVDKEQDVVCDKSLDRADLDSEEISCRQAFPMSSEKRRPRGVLVSLRGGLNTVFSENISDGAASDLMSQIG